MVQSLVKRKERQYLSNSLLYARTSIRCCTLNHHYVICKWKRQLFKVSPRACSRLEEAKKRKKGNATHMFSRQKKNGKKTKKQDAMSGGHEMPKWMRVTPGRCMEWKVHWRRKHMNCALTLPTCDLTLPTLSFFILKKKTVIVTTQGYFEYQMRYET